MPTESARRRELSQVSSSPALGGAGRVWLKVAVQRDDLDRVFGADIFLGRIFCETDMAVELGEQVWVHLNVGNEFPIFIGGRVWRRGVIDGVNGIGVMLDPTERPTLTYIQDWLFGRVSERREGHRYPIKIRVVYNMRGRSRITATIDVSDGGMFVATHESPAIGQHVILLLIPQGEPRQVLRAKVVRVVEGEGKSGIGVAFERNAVDAQNRYFDLVRRVEELVRC